MPAPGGSICFRELKTQFWRIKNLFSKRRTKTFFSCRHTMTAHRTSVRPVRPDGGIRCGGIRCGDIRCGGIRGGDTLVPARNRTLPDNSRHVRAPPDASRHDAGYRLHLHGATSGRQRMSTSRLWFLGCGPAHCPVLVAGHRQRAGRWGRAGGVRRACFRARKCISKCGCRLRSTRQFF